MSFAIVVITLLAGLPCLADSRAPIEAASAQEPVADAPLTPEATRTTATETDADATSGSDLIEERYSGHIDEDVFAAVRQSLPAVYDHDTGEAISYG